MPFPLNPFWIKKIRRYVRENGIDIIIVRDIPLAIPAIIAGRARSVPVVLDMAEHYGAMFSDFVKDSPGLKKVPRYLLKNPIMADITEKVVLKYINHIMVVVEESKWRLEKLGVPAEKISIVSNTPPITKRPEDKIDLPEGLKLVYIGQLQHTRGIGTVIEGFRYLLKKRSDINLYIAGSGEQAEYFKRLAGKSGVTGNVHFLGWIKPDIAYRYINSCDIGIVPPLATKHIISTIPNKIFDYMLCGLAVLVSDAAPLKRIVDESRCGWSFEAGNPQAFADRVLKISESPDIAAFGANGRQAVIDRYNWAVDCRVIDEVIERFAAQKGIDSADTI